MVKPQDFKKRIDKVDKFLIDNWWSNMLKPVSSKIKLRKVSGGIVAFPSQKEIGRIKTDLFPLADEKEYDFIILDLGQCKIINSSDMSRLIQLLDRCRVNNKGFALTRLLPTLKVILKVAGLIEEFNIFENIDQAIEYFVSKADKDT